jgi:hypothetical protein
MGGSSSKSKQTITNNTVNQNYMNTLNKTIMDSAVNTMIKNASSCSSSVNINNSCNMSGTNVGGDFNFDGNQTAEAKVNFNCIQANQTSADMATSMMTSMVAEMKALNGTDAAAQLNTASQSSNTTGFASTPGGGSKSSSSANVTNNVTNETISNVENVFQQNLSNNFSAETVNECIGKTSVSNSQDLSNMDISGNAKVSCIQTASVEQVQNCKQLSEAISKTTQATFQELGMKTDSTSQTSSATESTVSSKSENVATGPIQEIGKAVSDMLTALGLAMLAPFIGPICSICCCIVIVLCLVFVFKAVAGGGGDNSNSSFTSGMSGMSGMSNIPSLAPLAPLGSSDVLSSSSFGL